METYIGILKNVEDVGFGLGNTPNLELSVGDQKFFTYGGIKVPEEIFHALGKRIRVDYEKSQITIRERIWDFLICWDARTPRRYNQIKEIEIM